MSNKCFCHLTVKGESYEVKDANARERLNNVEQQVGDMSRQVSDIETLKADVETLKNSGGGNSSKEYFTHIFCGSTFSNTVCINFEFKVKVPTDEIEGDTLVSKINNALQLGYEFSIQGVILESGSIKVIRGLALHSTPSTSLKLSCSQSTFSNNFSYDIYYSSSFTDENIKYFVL